MMCTCSTLYIRYIYLMFMPFQMLTYLIIYINILYVCVCVYIGIHESKSNVSTKRKIYDPKQFKILLIY